jgi:hypothetical protein
VCAQAVSRRAVLWRIIAGLTSGALMLTRPLAIPLVAGLMALRRSAGRRVPAWIAGVSILCIAPWQIEDIGDSVDILMNSHSFVEMPRNVVRNYLDKFRGLPDAPNAGVALVTYDGFDPGLTIPPGELPKFLEDRQFDHFEAETLLESARKNTFFVAPGKLARRRNPQG